MSNRLISIIICILCVSACVLFRRRNSQLSARQLTEPINCRTSNRLFNTHKAYCDSAYQLLVIICARNPTSALVTQITNLYEFQVTDLRSFKIVCVDSDSEDTSTYNIVARKFPEVEIMYAKNKNYEYGAYKYALTKYPNCQIYMCIQDTLTVTRKIDLSIIDDKNAYNDTNHAGFYDHMSIKDMAIQLLQGTGLQYEDVIHTRFHFCTHCSFIVSNAVMHGMFKTLINPPTNKDGSCCYERLFGLFFVLNGIQMHNMSGCVQKTHGNRN
jgi:hypothetical protein